MSKQKRLSREEYVKSLAQRIVRIGDGAKSLAEVLATRLVQSVFPAPPPKEQQQYASLTDLAQRDPIGMGYNMAKLTIRHDQKAQRNGELRKENRKLRQERDEQMRLIVDLRAERDRLRKIAVGRLPLSAEDNAELEALRGMLNNGAVAAGGE